MDGKTPGGRKGMAAESRKNFSEALVVILAAATGIASMTFALRAERQSSPRSNSVVDSQGRLRRNPAKIKLLIWRI